MSETEQPESHLVDDRSFAWDWGGEDPVEIILVVFILVLFFTLPRGGCGVDKTRGDVNLSESTSQSQSGTTADR